MKKNNGIDRETILEKYGDYILNNGERPANVYVFSKENGFEEKDFYHFFSGFDHLEKQILTHFFDQTIALVKKQTQRQNISAKENLLNVYFVFFENLTMNRSLVLQILGDGKLNQLKALEELRMVHHQYVSKLDFSTMKLPGKSNETLKKIQEQIKKGALWLHFLSIMEFWKNDTSKDFEKTDIFIEKTIDTGFELIDTEPLKKMVDLGKFLWKEGFKMA